MWIIHCTELGTSDRAAHHFIVGPFGTDDQAEHAAGKLQARAGNGPRVRTDIQPLVEPARAMAGATF